MGENEPRDISAMSPEDWANAKPGDKITVTMSRGAEYKFHYADDVIFGFAVGGAVDIVFTRQEPVSYIRELEVADNQGLGTALRVTNVAMAQGGVVVANCRVPLLSATNLPAAILRQLSQVDPVAYEAAVHEVRSIIDAGPNEVA